MPTVGAAPLQEMMDDSTPSKPGSSSAIAIDDLWFSYEVATAINESLTIDKSQRGDALAIEKSQKTRDGGLSVANPRGQYQAALGPGLAPSGTITRTTPPPILRCSAAGMFDVPWRRIATTPCACGPSSGSSRAAAPK